MIHLHAQCGDSKGTQYGITHFDISFLPLLDSNLEKQHKLRHYKLASNSGLEDGRMSLAVLESVAMFFVPGCGVV